MQVSPPALGVFKRQSQSRQRTISNRSVSFSPIVIVTSASARATSDGKRSPHSTSTSASCRSSISETPSASKLRVVLQPVQIQVIHRQLAAVVLMHQRERRARHIVRLRSSQRRDDSLHQRRLSRAQVAAQQHQLRRPQQLGHHLAQRQRSIGTSRAQPLLARELRPHDLRHRGAPNSRTPGEPCNPRNSILILHPRAKRPPQMIDRIHRQHRVLILRQRRKVCREPMQKHRSLHRLGHTAPDTAPASQRRSP